MFRRGGGPGSLAGLGAGRPGELPLSIRLTARQGHGFSSLRPREFASLPFPAPHEHFQIGKKKLKVRVEKYSKSDSTFPVSAGSVLTLQSAKLEPPRSRLNVSP